MPVFATLIQLRAGGLVIGPDPFFNSQIEQLAALVLHPAVPAVVRRGRRSTELRIGHYGVFHQLEAGASQPRRATLEVIRRAFEVAGVEFIDENGGGPGVRLRKRQRAKKPT
jgi:hypothetical protein